MEKRRGRDFGSFESFVRIEVMKLLQIKKQSNDVIELTKRDTSTELRTRMRTEAYLYLNM